jgi:hypothetical protein
MHRWLRWLTYSYDPELHSRLDAIEKRLASLTPTAVSAKPAPTSRRHDCGHEAVSYATDGNGVTRCRECQDRWLATTTRQKAPLF